MSSDKRKKKRISRITHLGAGDAPTIVNPASTATAPTTPLATMLKFVADYGLQ
jgi:hypothetical protein